MTLVMDAQTARQTILEQDEILRTQLRPIVAKQARKATQFAKAIEDLLESHAADIKKPWWRRPPSRLWIESSHTLLEIDNDYGDYNFSKPKTSPAYFPSREVTKAVAAVLDWTERGSLWAGRLSKLAKQCPNFGQYVNRLTIRRTDLDRMGIGSASKRGRHLPPDSIISGLKGCGDAMRSLATALREPQLPTPLLAVPDEVHPARHGRLGEGMLARLVAEDLQQQIEAGRDLAATLASEPSTAIQDWRRHTADVLRRLETSAVHGFWTLMSGCDACDAPLIADPRALGRAYLSLGLTYLEEVHERMPDYAEASGQQPPEARVSMTISGGTFYGGQFAVQIANIQSTIAGIHQAGATELADALASLQQAVLTQPGMEDDKRRDLLDNLEYLADSARKPPEKRSRGIIRSALTALSAAAATGTALGDAVTTWEGALHTLLT